MFDYLVMTYTTPDNLHWYCARRPLQSDPMPPVLANQAFHPTLIIRRVEINTGLYYCIRL